MAGCCGRLLMVAGGLAAVVAAIGAGLYYQFQQAVEGRIKVGGMEPVFPLGNVAELFKTANFLDGLSSLTRDHADQATGLASIWQLSAQMISVSHHEDVKQVMQGVHRENPPHVQALMEAVIGRTALISLSGEEWEWKRKAVEKALAAFQISLSAPDLVRAADRAASVMGETGRLFDAVYYLEALVMEAVGVATHGRPLVGYNDGTYHAAKFMIQELIRRVASPNPADSRLWVPSVPNQQLREAIALFRGSILDELRARRNGTSPHLHHEDFLRYYMQDAEGFRDEEEIVDAVSASVFGATEVCTSILSYAFHHLGADASYQQRIAAEAAEAFGQEGAVDFHRLPFTFRFVREVMRLYPPTPLLQRTLPAPLPLQHGGVTLPKGTLVWVPVWVAHRLPHNVPDPLVFNPDRFATPAPPSAPRINIPFSMGRRNCPGAGFAESFLAVAVARIVQQTEVQGHQKEPVPFSNGFVQFPQGGVQLVAKPRKA